MGFCRNQKIETLNPGGDPRWAESYLVSIQKHIALQLCGSLQVDIGKTRELPGWSPPISVDEGLRRTAGAFLRLRW